MSAWILLLMIGLQPSAPWRDTYATTANAIARAAEAEPLFAGEDGPARTAALLVSVAWFEGRYDPNAHNAKDPGGGSFGMFQSSRKPIASVDDQVKHALAALRVSFRECASRRSQDWVALYASGSCTNVGGQLASRRRMGLAQRIFHDHPPPSRDVFPDLSAANVPD